MKIKLYNRDGANMWLEQIKEANDKTSLWQLKVDKKHLYCLNYLRCIGDYPNNLEAVDPSGGPMINVGDKFMNKYKIVRIINPTTFEIWEE